jgi:hypothetical protein
MTLWQAHYCNVFQCCVVTLNRLLGTVTLLHILLPRKFVPAAMATVSPSGLSDRPESCSANTSEIIDLCSDDSEGPQPRGKPISTDRVACHDSEAEEPVAEGVPASSCVICTVELMRFAR